MTLTKLNEDAKFRKELAVAAVKAAHPSGLNGGYYADIVAGVLYFREANAAWNPWADDAVVVNIQLLVDPSNVCDLSDYVNWKEDYGNLSEYFDMAVDYLAEQANNSVTDDERTANTLEEDGSLPEWVDPREVISWARECPEYTSIIDAYEQTAHDEAVALAMSEIIDEIDIE